MTITADYNPAPGEVPGELGRNVFAVRGVARILLKGGQARAQRAIFFAESYRPLFRTRGQRQYSCVQCIIRVYAYGSV